MKRLAAILPFVLILTACSSTSKPTRTEVIATKLDDMRAQAETVEEAEFDGIGLRSSGDPVCVGLYENYAAVLIFHKPKKKKSILKKMGSGAVSVVKIAARLGNAPGNELITNGKKSDKNELILDPTSIVEAQKAGISQAYASKCPVQPLLDLGA